LGDTALDPPLAAEKLSSGVFREKSRSRCRTIDFLTPIFPEIYAYYNRQKVMIFDLGASSTLDLENLISK